MKTIEEYNQIFYDFVSKYDTSNSNILRKMIHCFSVAENCFSIACALDMSIEDTHFAYLCGLFHDLGRFEQWKRFNSYNDFSTLDHGDLSGQLIMELKNLGLSKTEQKKLAKICALHTKPGDNDEIFDLIVKNADSYANIVTVTNGSMPVSNTENGFSEEILNNFLEMKPLRRFVIKTKLDRCLCMSACCYYITFDFLRKDILNKKYLDAMERNFKSVLNNKDFKIYKDAIESVKSKLL